MDAHMLTEEADDNAVKRVKLSSSTALMVMNDKEDEEAQSKPDLAPGRFSSLIAPSLALTGHQGEVFALDFHPRGDYIATAGRDRSILLWKPTGTCPNTSILYGHGNAVLDCHFSPDGQKLVSCGADKCGFIWDLETNEHIKRLRHEGIVNSCDVRRQGISEFITGSDDKTVKLWDLRSKDAKNTLDYPVPVTAVCHANDMIFVGGIDGAIRGYDQRNLLEPSMTLNGHNDVITCISLSHNGGNILTNAMDATLRVFDIRPFAPQDRNTLTFYGTQHGFEKNLIKCAWSSDDSKVVSGSADRLVYVYRVRDGALIGRLPGHQGSVNCVGWHPIEPIIASGSSDKIVMIGEVDFAE